MQGHGFRGRLRGEEDKTVIQFAADLRQWTLEGILKATWTNIPHEVGFFRKADMARVSKQRYAKALASGLVPGSGDFVFVGQGGRGGWIEFKSRTGSLSADQKDFRDWCAMLDIPHRVCRTREQGRQALIEWGMLCP